MAVLMVGTNHRQPRVQGEQSVGLVPNTSMSERLSGQERILGNGVLLISIQNMSGTGAEPRCTWIVDE